MEHPSTGNGVEAVVRRNPGNGTVSIQGRITGLGVTPMKIMWIAAAPVTRGIGFSGSGQPYPSREIALEGTPNRGSLESGNGNFSITLTDIPAGYYSGLGSVYVPPMVEFLALTKDGKRLHASLWINDTAAPYRWISGAPAAIRPEAPDMESMGRAMYYLGRDGMPLFDNQEAQLRAKAYPCEMVAHGWPQPADEAPWKSMPPPA